MKTFMACLEEGLFDWWKNQQKPTPGQPATGTPKPPAQPGTQPAATPAQPVPPAPHLPQPKQDFGGFLKQFAASPYHINPHDLQAVMANPRDRGAMDRINSRNGYVGRMIQKFQDSKGEDQEHEKPDWGNDDFWGGGQGR